MVVPFCESDSNTCTIEHLYDLYHSPGDTSSTTFEHMFEIVRVSLPWRYERWHRGLTSRDGRIVPGRTRGPGRGDEAVVARVTELPDGPADESGLTPRQRAILAMIRDTVETRGYPPSVREIGEGVGLTSPSSVAHQLGTLERMGYLRRDPNRPRALVVADLGEPARARPGNRARARPCARSSRSRPATRHPSSRGRLRPGRRADRRRWPDPRGAGGRGGLPAPPRPRRRRASCSCSRWSATR